MTYATKQGETWDEVSYKFTSLKLINGRHRSKVTWWIAEINLTIAPKKQVKSTIQMTM